MAYDRKAVLQAFRAQDPAFADVSDDSLASALSAELGEPDEARWLPALGAELGLKEVKPKPFLAKAGEFLASIPKEIAKDIASVPQVPIDLAKSLGAVGALNDLQPVDYVSLRAQGSTHEQAKAAVENYIAQLQDRSKLLQESAATGQEHATRAAAAALSTAATGGVAGALGRAPLAAAGKLALEGVVGGATYGGVGAAGRGGSAADIARDAAIGGVAGGVLGPVVPAAARFVGREVVAPIGKIVGKVVKVPAKGGAAVGVKPVVPTPPGVQGSLLFPEQPGTPPGVQAEMSFGGRQMELPLGDQPTPPSFPIGVPGQKVPMQGSLLFPDQPTAPGTQLPIPGPMGRQLSLDLPAGGSGLPRGGASTPAFQAKVALAGTAPGNPAVQRLMQALETAGPLRVSQERAMAAERGARAAKFRTVGESAQGERGARRQLAQLAGELPRVDFETLRGKIAQADIDELFNMIRVHPALREFEQARGFTALSKILGEAGGAVPQKGEIELLQAVFGPKFTETLLKKRSTFAKAKDLGIELFNLPRALMSSMDLSAPFRQGAFLIGRPKEFAPAFVEMFKVVGNQRAFDALNQNIANRPNASLYRAANLALSEVGGILEKREEAFISGLAEKIPVIGAGVRASQRAYVGFLNKLRADTFDTMMRDAAGIGHDIADPRFIKSLGEFINSATGRGKLPTRTLEQAAPALSTIFFSPRLLASRVNLLNPVFYARLDPYVRKEAIKSAISAGALGVSVLGLLKASGAQVETDPRSSDFGKVRIGNTRFDIFAGFQQYVRLGAQLLPNFGTDLPFGGVKSPVTGRLREYGKGFNAPTRLKQISDFAENKLAPVPSMIVDIFRGKHRIPETSAIDEIEAMAAGEEVKPSRRSLRREIDPWVMAENSITPLAMRDAVDAMAEWGTERGIVMALPAMFGVGIQSMPSPKRVPSPIPGSRLEQLMGAEADSVGSR